jgi:FkbM family methyltransferase
VVGDGQYSPDKHLEMHMKIFDFLKRHQFKSEPQPVEQLMPNSVNDRMSNIAIAEVQQGERPMPNSANDRMSDIPVAEMPLIMDIGMNNGLDSLFYLRKGFRVVAIEANPLLVKKAQFDLASYIASGQLIIEHVGLGEQEGQFNFYINLENDHWSSFVKDYGTRNGTRYEEISINCIKPQSLFEKYGMPYYLKIDIEGKDINVVRSLHDFTDRPQYISIEENQTYFFAELWSLGYRGFKLVDQRNLTQVKCPNPPLEGIYVDATFDGNTSGPFGKEAPGEWMTFDLALEKYLTEIRSPTRGYLVGHSWFDIHGRIE